MASLAQVAGQYGFLLFNADGIGSNPTSGWVLLVGVLWIVRDDLHLLPRHRGVGQLPEGAARPSSSIMLLVLSVTALVKVGTGNAPAGPPHAERCPGSTRSTSRNFSAFVSGVILMVFIYWGWDTAVAVNEETKDPNKTPGRAAIISTVHPAGHLRARDLLDAVLRRHRRPPATASATWTTPATCCPSRARSVFGTSGFGTCPVPPAAADGAVLGRGLDPDHDPAHRPDHPVDGGLQGDPARRSRRSTAGT